MALKRQKKVPQIPRTREKSIDKMKYSTPKEKGGEIEYICNVYFYFNPHSKKQQYCFSVEKIKLFSSLNYELTLMAEKKKKEIDISVLGLKAKQVYFTESGPAVGSVCFEDVYGEHIVNLIKPDGTINSADFSFNMFKKEIILLKEFMPAKKNNRKFCKFKVVNSYFTFGS